MNKFATLVALILLLTLVSPAMAGIEPSPWRSELGVLNSIVNCLSEVNQRVNAALARMGVGPSPFHSSVNQLEAMANQLDLLGSRLEGVLDAIPSEGGDEEVSSALLEVRNGALQIVRQTAPPNCPKEVAGALERVRDSAQAIADMISGQVPS